MRLEDSVVGLEHAEQNRGLLEEQEEQFEDGFSARYDEAVVDTSQEQRSRHDDVLAAVQTIFAGKKPEFEQLQLSRQERSALQSLRSAYVGKDPHYGTFVFAEQRREMLEQALAALEPVLALDISTVPELREGYAQLVLQVTELREKLLGLEDSQDDELVTHERVAKKEDETDEPDSDETDDETDGNDSDANQAGTASNSGDLAETLVAASTEIEPASVGVAQAGRESGVATASKPAGKSGVLSLLGRALGRGRSGDDGKGSE
jgi:hypothetical protein